MRQGVHPWGFLAVLMVWALIAIFATPVGAATTTLYSLPLATHGSALTVGADGVVWFAGTRGSRHESGAGSFVGHLSPDGRVSEFSLPDDGEAGAPTFGLDGDVWFPESFRDEQGAGSPRIGRISSSGDLQEYSLGDEDGEVRSLAMLNGDLWFAATRGSDAGVRSTISRIATSADDAIQEFALRSACFAEEITAAGGAIWFTESCQRRSPSGRLRPSASISRISPAGEIVRHPLPRRNYPVAITADSEGTVWFGATRSDYSTPRIGRITPTGDFAEYRVPHSRPTTIAVGGEGRLWFSSSFGGAFFRALRSIDKQGRLSKPICVDPGCGGLEASGLATGPDGSVWFSASRRSSIGGGGMTQITQHEQIANEAGTIGKLTP